MKTFAQLTHELTEAGYRGYHPRTTMKKAFNDNNIRHTHEDGFHVIKSGNVEYGRAKFGDKAAIANIAGLAVKHGTSQGNTFYPKDNIGGVIQGSPQGAEYDTQKIADRIASTEK